jgi:hypothetical protein
MTNLNRREFIKLTAVAMGGIMLPGCGGGGKDTPSSYSFYRIKDNGAVVDPMGESFVIERFYGSTHIASNGIISFDAMDSDRRRGLFQLGIDLDGRRPEIVWERSALLSGETLADGRIVSTCKGYDIDESGNIAAIIEARGDGSEDHYGAGLYLDMEGTGFVPLLIAGQVFNDGTGISSGIFGDLSFVAESVLTVAHHLPKYPDSAYQGHSLLHLPGAALSASKVLSTSGEFLPGTDHRISNYGLLDHNGYGDYTAGISARDTGSAEPEHSHFNVGGNIDYPGDLQVMTASAQTAMDASVVSGEGGYGSRVGPQGEAYALLDIEDSMKLTRDNQVILSTGDLLPTGTLAAITTGAVGADGLYYYGSVIEAAGVNNMALYVYDGVTHTPLLSTGDVLSDGGAPVEQILFGTSTKHVDSENRLVLFCSFADGTTSLVLGIPA